MLRSRLCLLLLLAGTVPVQTIAAASAPLTLFAIPTSGMPMDCHAVQASDVPEPPSCCGDACPDMSVCAAAQAVSATTVVSAPFRPPTLSRV